MCRRPTGFPTQRHDMISHPERGCQAAPQLTHGTSLSQRLWLEFPDGFCDVNASTRV
jgi:hypothetical protein